MKNILMYILWILALVVVLPALPFLIILRLIFRLEERKNGKFHINVFKFEREVEMKKMMLNLFFCISVICSGCATIMTGKYQSIPVTSEPSGVKVRADTGESIITPGKFHLIRNEEHTLLAEYPGHESQQITLHNKAQGWVWGNILLGGGIGLIVDVVSGASDELIPKKVHFNFVSPELTTQEATKIKKDEPNK